MLEIGNQKEETGGESVSLKKVSGIAHEKFLTSQLDLKISSFVKILLFSKTFAEIFCIPTLVMVERGILETCAEYIYIYIWISAAAQTIAIIIYQICFQCRPENSNLSSGFPF